MLYLHRDGFIANVLRVIHIVSELYIQNMNYINHKLLIQINSIHYWTGFLGCIHILTMTFYLLKLLLLCYYYITCIDVLKSRHFSKPLTGINSVNVLQINWGSKTSN